MHRTMEFIVEQQAEPHGLGWADPALSVDDDYCGTTGTWLGSSECEEMERQD